MCSCDQSLVTLTFLWEKLPQPQFYKDLTRKTAFFEGWSWFKFNHLEQALVTNFKVYTSVAKGLKLKVRKFWGPIRTFVEVTGEKLVGGKGAFLHIRLPLPSWIWLKRKEEFMNFWIKEKLILRIYWSRRRSFSMQEVGRKVIFP